MTGNYHLTESFFFKGLMIKGPANLFQRKLNFSRTGNFFFFELEASYLYFCNTVSGL